MTRLTKKPPILLSLSLALSLSAAPVIDGPLLPACTASVAWASPSAKGNTSGNFQNGGAAAEADGWLYYYENGDLLKARPGEDGTVLVNDINSQLPDPFWGNLNLADGQIFFRTLHGAVYKVSQNGGTPEIFFPAKTPFGTGTCEIFLSGDWLYFNYETTTGMERTSMICRIHPDGTGGEVLKDGTGKEMYWLLDVTEDTIYYTGICHEENVFYNYQMSLDGQNSRRIDFIPYTPILQAVDGWLYFRDSTDDAIKKICPDGSGLQTIHSRPAAMSFNVSADGSWIYFSSLAQGDTEAAYMRIKTDGTCLQSLGQLTMYHASIAGDRIVSLTSGNMRMIPQASGIPKLEKTGGGFFDQ